ncbi:hypothetical protein D9757_012468 [Collybiopsis confluens]|uniref:Uncharacterized protein n=1 Tax=Collybiopsis confluens TaxID=2823264 RepID=A0A8H5LEV0_9AGAR|nr:hypothetical protein D9757_012468 [Collybiopsis confluens]
MLREYIPPIPPLSTFLKMPPTLANTLYYGVGFFGLGIISLASLGMKNVLGDICRRLWDRKNDHVKGLKQTIAHRDAEILHLRNSLSSAEARSVGFERQLADARKQVTQVNQQKTELETRKRAVSVQKENVEYELGLRQEELSASREDVQRVQETLRQTQTLLDIRTSELRVSEAFLSRSDRFAGADVTKMIETLNFEIHQTASLMADEFSPQLKLSGGPGAMVPSVNEQGVGVHEAAVVHTEDILGEGVAKMLQTFNHREDGILLQIAFQASMCAFTEWIMDSWCYHQRESEVEAVLQEIYELLRETEEQSVSARWRILTRKYVRQLFPPVEQPSLTYHIFAACANILITAGLHESEQQLMDTLAARFSKQIADLVDRAIHLNNVIGDDVTSCEFVPIYCTPDVIFDPGTMEAPYSTGITGQESDKIMCTTDLGLLRAEKVQGEERTWHNSILLKPKIIMAADFTASPTSTDSSPGWKTRWSDGQTPEV